MLRFKYWVKNFFGFPRAQVNGFVILLIFVSLSIFSEPVWQWLDRNKTRDFTADMAKLDSLTAIWVKDTSRSKSFHSIAPTKLFAFDPNNVSSEKLATLGFPDQLVKRIIRYREKGGKFRKKSDLAKIYGIDSAFYLRLYPFIALAEKPKPYVSFEKKFSAKDIPSTYKKLERFDLNKADTSLLKRVNGIGEKLSLRILRYRDAIGGFISMEQLKEIYGLDSLVVKRLGTSCIITSEFEPAKININLASEKELAAHPYFRKFAKAIVSYRFQHGNFKTIDEIRNVGTIDAESITKLIPYGKVDDEL